MFLTSMLVMAMVAPAYADVFETSAGATSPVAGACVQAQLGTDVGPATINAKWTGNKSGAITIDSKLYTSTSDTTGTAATTAATPTPVYTVYGDGTTPDADGNTGGVYNAIPTTNDTGKITQLTQNPELTGYTWGGFWTEKTGTGTQVVDTSGNFTADTNTLYTSDTPATATWYAKWTPNIYTVTLRPEYYASSTATSSSATSGNPTTTVYEKYATGWYKESTATTQITSSVALGTMPTYTGYTFGGYYTGKAGTGTQIFTAAGKLANNATATGAKVFADDNGELWAKWTAKTYNIKYRCGGGADNTDYGTLDPAQENITFNAYWSGIPAAKQITLGSTPTGQPHNSDSVTGCSRVGFHPTGWSCTYDTGGAAVAADITTITSSNKKQWTTASNATCVLQWTQNTIDLSWSSNGGNTYTVSNDAAKTCTYEGAVTLPTNNPTRTGYTFSGWKLAD